MVNILLTLGLEYSDFNLNCSKAKWTGCSYKTVRSWASALYNTHVCRGELTEVNGVTRVAKVICSAKQSCTMKLYLSSWLDRM